MMRTVLLLFTLLGCAFAAGDAREVQYRITLSDPSQHKIHVSMNFAAAAAGDLQMPVWNATYQVREFSQYVSHVTAQGATIQKLNTSRWHLEPSQARVTVEYDEVADLPGPFGMSFDSNHAFLNFAMVLMYPEGLRKSPVRLDIENAPAGWRIATALPAIGGATGGHATFAMHARNYDHLVDSPVELGEFTQLEFPLHEAKVKVAIHGAPADYDSAKITASLQKITLAATDWMGETPFTEYTFIFHFPRGPARGGMEHAYSTAIDVNAERLRADYPIFEGVSTHEFFHLWNVKRIRPQSLEPVDFTREQPTDALWFSEGVTSTVGSYIQMRAGLEDEQRFLSHLGEAITELQSRPAHLWQSAEESSLETWYDKYPFYRLPERSINYYNKGEILGYLLDLRIRELTAGKKSLRDVFRYLNEQYAHKGKFFPDSVGVQQAAEAVAGQSLEGFFADCVSGTKEIPYNDFLRAAGLTLTHSHTSVPDIGFDAVRNFSGPLIVVRSDDAGRQSGAKLGDAILAINGKVPVADLVQELSRFQAGDQVEVRLRASNGEERSISATLKVRAVDQYAVTDLSHQSVEQRKIRAQWLSGDSDRCTADCTGSPR